MVSKYYRMGSTGKDGDNAVDLFKKIALSKNYTFRDATREEDIYKHFDIVMYDETMKETKVDVKARKKLNRVETDYMVDHMWVECYNVFGSLGWLYGEANIIAQQIDKYFMLIDRVELALFISNKLENKLVTERRDALYKMYQRKDRKDILTLIKLSDLPVESYCTWIL
jgi:hypothetical protein